MSLYFGYDLSSPASEDVVEYGKINRQIDMGTFKITQSAAPTNGNHLANKKYVDDTSESKATSISTRVATNSQASLIASGDALKGTAKGNINMNTYSITQSSRPIINNHLANKAYVDASAGSQIVESNWRTWSYYLSSYVAYPEGISNEWPHAPIAYVPKANSYIRISNLGLAYGTSNASPNVTVEFNLRYKTIINNAHNEHSSLLFSLDCRTGRFTLPDGETTRVFCYDINRDFKLSDITTNWKSIKGFSVSISVPSGDPFNLKAVLSVCTIEK